MPNETPESSLHNVNEQSPERSIYYPSSNGALDLLISDHLTQSTIDFFGVERDLEKHLDDIDERYLTEESFHGLVFEAHVRRVIASVEKRRQFKGEDLAGLATKNYTCERQPMDNLILFSPTGKILSTEAVQIDADVRLNNNKKEGVRGTYRMGIIEAKASSPASGAGRERLIEVMSLDRITDIGLAIEELRQEDPNCTGWSYILVIPEYLSTQATTYQEEFVRNGGRVVIVPIKREDLQSKSTKMLQKFRAAKGLPPEKVIVPQNDDDLYPERAAWREEYEPTPEDS